MATYDSYVICTSPRSGSTLLCKLLASSGVAGNPDSWFHSPSVSDWLGYYNLTPEPSLDERDLLELSFRSAIAEGTQGKGLFGLRMQHHSFAFFRQKLALLHPELPNDIERFRAAFGRTLFIHLTRQDKVEQAVSYVKANQSGLWHAAPDGTELERLSPPAEPVYSAREILQQFEEMTASDHDWARWFDSENISPLRITYESLSKSPIETLRALLDTLGLDPNIANNVEIGVAKLADERNKQWAARFRSTYEIP